MADEEDPRQIAIMKQMLALSEQQVELSKERTRMSEDRSRMSEDRSRMSEDRSRMSEARSEMSEVRSYHNAERTLSVWVRTALSLMIFGIAIDRFGLLLRQIPGTATGNAGSLNAPLELASTWAGAALVVLAIFMALATGLRFVAYARDWRKQHILPAHHGPYLATFFALAVAFFGAVLLVFMLLFAD